MNVRNAAVAASVALLSVAAVPAQATTFEFSGLTASWSNVKGGSLVKTHGNGTRDALLSWGLPTTHGGQSAFGFDYNKKTSTTIAADSSAAFELGSFSHYNRPINAKYPAITSATLTLKGIVSLGGVSLGEKLFTYKIGLDETDNEAKTCAYGGKNGKGINAQGCADKVSIDSMPASESFSYGGVDYTMSLTGFEYGKDWISAFLSAENACNSLDLWVKLISATTPIVTPPGEVGPGEPQPPISGAVPEPASWAMMIAGFGLIGGAMRRRDVVRAAIA